MKTPLRNQVAIVTGAGRGIGYAIACKLAAEGVKLMLVARTEINLLELRQHLIHDCAIPSENLAYEVSSVSDAAAVERVVTQTIQLFGRIDILINNAGVPGPVGLLQEASIVAIDQTIDTNLKGPLYYMKFVVPQMVHQGGGTIININSIAGKTTFPFWSVYCASKYGLTAVTQAVSEEQRNNNIKVIGIYPGAVDTPLWEGVEPETEPDKAGMLDANDIADTILFTLHQQPKTLIQDITLSPLKPVL